MEGADGSTLRADEVGTLRSFINVDHIESNRWAPPFDADWHASCQGVYKGIGRGRMGRAVMSQQRDEQGKAMKAAKDRDEEYYDPARREDILVKNKDTSGVEGRTPQRPNCGLGNGAKLLGESLLRLAIGSKRLVESRVGCSGLRLCVCQDFANDVGKALLGRRLALPGPMGQCARTASTCWNVPGKYGLLFFFIKKEQVAISNEVPFGPFVSAETLKACALIGLHLLAAEGEAGLSGSQSPDLGDMWRYGCPKCPKCFSPCSASETSFGREGYEHNSECRAIEVIGQGRSSEVVAIFLEDWELGRVALRCHMTMDLLCQEMRDACWGQLRVVGFSFVSCHSKQAFLSPWTGCDSEGEVCGERK